MKSICQLCKFPDLLRKIASMHLSSKLRVEIFRIFNLSKWIIQSVKHAIIFWDKNGISLDPHTLKTQVRPAIFSQMPTELSEQIYSIFHIEQCCWFEAPSMHCNMNNLCSKCYRSFLLTFSVLLLLMLSFAFRYLLYVLMLKRIFLLNEAYWVLSFEVHLL